MHFEPTVDFRQEVATSLENVVNSLAQLNLSYSLSKNALYYTDLPFFGIVGFFYLDERIVISVRFYAFDYVGGLLIQGDHMDNKALHFNPRFDAGGGWFMIYLSMTICSFPGFLAYKPANAQNLLLNTLSMNPMGCGRRFTNPFEPGKPFQIRILVLENYFKIAVNGKHICDFPHRVPVSDVKTIYVGGNIRVDFIEFQPPDNNG
ncbi:galactoside-binding lectin [Ostertagia ostertagi]